MSRETVLRLAAVVILAGAILVAMSLSPLRRASAFDERECRFGDGISQIAACNNVQSPPVVDERTALRISIGAAGAVLALVLVGVTLRPRA